MRKLTFCVCILLIVPALEVCGRELSKEEVIKELKMILIPEGEFIMGSDNPFDNPDQKPKHKVFLSSYRISKYEVTNEMFKAFVMDGGYKRKELWTPEGWKFIQENMITHPAGWRVRGFDDPQKPVVGVSWYEAYAFAKWLGMRLPTEAEWEKAARGTDGRVYPWGNEFDASRVFYKAIARPLRVGSFPSGASPYGVLDMAGNVWEWVWDWYGERYYARSPYKNPKGPENGEYKVVRGGGWGCNRRQMRCAYRRHEKPTWRRLDVGFRVVQDLK